MYHLFASFGSAPLIRQIALIQQDNPVNEGTGHVVLEALADLLGSLGDIMDKVLGDKPDLGHNKGVDRGYLDSMAYQIPICI